MEYLIDFNPDKVLNPTEVTKRILRFLAWINGVQATVDWIRAADKIDKPRMHILSLSQEIILTTFDKELMVKVIAPEIYSLGAKIRVRIDNEFFPVDLS